MRAHQRLEEEWQRLDVQQLEGTPYNPEDLVCLADRGCSLLLELQLFILSRRLGPSPLGHA